MFDSLQRHYNSLTDNLFSSEIIQNESNWFTSIKVLLTILGYYYFTYIPNNINKLFSCPTAITLFSLLYSSQHVHVMSCAAIKRTHNFPPKTTYVILFFYHKKKRKKFITRDTIQEIQYTRNALIHSYFLLYYYL